MLKTLRIVLMWLLAFAVPVQGFAATTMLFCMGEHHHAEVSAAKSMPHEHRDTHDHGDAHDVGQHGSIADHTSGDHTDEQTSAGPHEHASTHLTAGKCSNCSACCMSVAMPTSAIQFEPLKTNSELVVVELSTQPVFLTDGPERPPRIILA